MSERFSNVPGKVGTFLERVPERFGTYLERVPERWNALTLTFLVDIWKVWNVFRMYLESLERFWNVPGTHVPPVPEHLFQNAQAFRNAAERTWNGEERWNGIYKGLWNAWRIYNSPKNDHSPN